MTLLKHLRDHGVPFLGRTLSVGTGADTIIKRQVIETLPNLNPPQARRRKPAVGASQLRLTLMRYIDDTTGETAEMRAAYKKMIKDEAVKSALLSKVYAVSSQDLNVTPFDEEDTRHRDVAEFVKWALENVEGGFAEMAKNLIIHKLIDGYSLSQIVMTVVQKGKFANKYALGSLKTKPTTTYNFGLNEFGDVEAVIGQGFNAGDAYDPSLFVINHHLKLYDNALGMSDMRAAYRCYDSDTEILTESGWKKIADLSDHDNVAALNTSNGSGKLVYERPTDRSSFHYQGKMFCQTGRFIDLCVTPNHRMWVKTRRSDDYSFVNAEDLFNDTHSRLVRYKRDAEWDGREQSTFTLPAIEFSQENANQNGGCGTIRKTTVVAQQLQMDDWLRFFGLWLAEGFTTRSKYRQKQCYVGICQNEGDTLDEIAEVVTRLGFKYRRSQKKGSRQCQLLVSRLQLYGYLKQFGKSHNKHIPPEIKKLSQRQLSILLEWMLKGDGRHRGTQYATVSKQLADDVSEIALKVGYAPTVYQEVMPNGNKIWIISLNKRSIGGTLVNEHKDNRSWKEYDGLVHCVTVPSGIVYVRRNGKACWCGNSYWIKDTAWKLRAIYLEKYGVGTMVGKFTQEDDKPLLEDALEHFRGATYMVVPQDVMIEAVDIAAKGQADYASAIQDLNHAIYLAIAGAILQALEGTSTGARSIGEVHKSTAELLVWALSQALCYDINKQIIPRLVDLNYAGIGDYPTVALGNVDDESLKASLEVDKGLKELGWVHSKKDIGERYGRAWPLSPDDELKAAPPPAPPGMPGQPGQSSGPGGGLSIPFSDWTPEDESKHPRGKDGTWIKKETLAEETRTPEGASRLRRRIQESDRPTFDAEMTKRFGEAYIPERGKKRIADAIVKEAEKIPVLDEPEPEQDEGPKRPEPPEEPVIRYVERLPRARQDAHPDLADIESELSPAEKREFETWMDNDRTEFEETAMSNGDYYEEPDEEDILKEAGWSNGDVEEAVRNRIDLADLGSDLTPEQDLAKRDDLKKILNDWYMGSEEGGQAALKELKGLFTDGGHEQFANEMYDQLNFTVEEDITKAKESLGEKATDDQMEAISDHYYADRYYEAREEYLKNFYKENPDRFPDFQTNSEAEQARYDAELAKAKAEHEKEMEAYRAELKTYNEVTIPEWQKRVDKWNAEHDFDPEERLNKWFTRGRDNSTRVFKFRNSNGTNFKIQADEEMVELPDGRQVKTAYITFEDADAGTYSVTHKGGAAEVFSTVSAAVVALVRKENYAGLKFSAAAEAKLKPDDRDEDGNVNDKGVKKLRSRQDLYEKLVKTVAVALNDYGALAMGGATKEDTDSTRYFVVAKRALIPMAKANSGNSRMFSHSGTPETIVMDDASEWTMLPEPNADELEAYFEDGWPIRFGDSIPYQLPPLPVAPVTSTQPIKGKARLAASLQAAIDFGKEKMHNIFTAAVSRAVRNGNVKTIDRLLTDNERRRLAETFAKVLSTGHLMGRATIREQMLGGAWAMQPVAIGFQDNWDESLHPRDRNGRFIDKADIQAAVGHPDKVAMLRGRVAPKDAQKLERALGGAAKVEARRPIVPFMPGANPDVAQRAYEDAIEHKDEYTQKYLHNRELVRRDPNDNVVSVTLNTDEWRDFFKEYKGTNAQDVHEAAALLNDELTKEAIQKMKGKGNNTIAFYGGGGGSGKGYATRNFIQESEYPIIMDKVFDSSKKIEKMLELARQNGYKAEYVFVDRDPEAAWHNGVIPRAVRAEAKGEKPRTVPLDIALDANINARRAALETLKTKPDLPVKVINNNGEIPRLITDRAEAIAHLEAQVAKYDSVKLLEKMYDDTRRLHESGKIPDHIAEGLIGPRSIVDRLRNARRDQSSAGIGTTADAAARTSIGGIGPENARPSVNPPSTEGNPGASVTAKRAAIADIQAKAYEFFSPNTEENLHFADAAERVKSSNQAAMRAIAEDISKQAGLPGVKSYNAIGDWADGAENSVVQEIHGPATMDAVRYAAANIGRATHQKAVLAVVADPEGPDSVWRTSVKGKDINQIRDSLAKHGIDFRTIVPNKDGADIFVFDQGRKLATNLEAFADEHDIQIRETRGRGEFLGADTRAGANREYSRAIADFEKDPAHPRYRPPQRVRNASPSTVAMSDWDETKHPRGQPENKGQFAETPDAPAASGDGTQVSRPEEDDYIARATSEYRSMRTKAPSFKKWFGDWENDPANASKVVDKDGEPAEQTPFDPDGPEGKAKAVYHGSLADFNEFLTSKIGLNASVVGKGFYFAENPAIATKYAQDKGVVFQVYLNIRKPFDHDEWYSPDEQKVFIDSIAKNLTDEEVGERGRDYAKQQLEVLFSQKTKTKDGHMSGYVLHTAIQDYSREFLSEDEDVGPDKSNEFLSRLGFDGITHRSDDLYGTPVRVKPPGQDKKLDYGRVWIAFRPNQIKAVKNRGTFSADTNDIRFADSPNAPTTPPRSPLQLSVGAIPPMTPEKALEYFSSLVPGVTGDPGYYADTVRRTAFTLAVSTDANVLKSVQNVITTSLASGVGGTPDVQDILTIAGISPRNPQYAEMVFRTNMMTSYMQGHEQERRDPEVVEFFPVWSWDTIMDGRERPTHGARNGKYYPAGVSFQEVRGDPDPAEVINCRCILPGNHVSARVLTASKSWYSGQAFEITTRSGTSITVTGNHPILTSQGFVAANQLRKGYNLVAYPSEVDCLISANDVQDNQTTIEKVFRSLPKSNTLRVSKRWTAFDFHGDGTFIDSEIQIKAVHRDLLLKLNPPELHSLRKCYLCQSHGRSGFMSCQCAVSSSLSQCGGFVNASEFNAFSKQSAGDYISADAKILCDRVDRSAFAVNRDKVARQLPFSRRVRRFANSHAAGTQVASQRRATNSQFSGKGNYCFASCVSRNNPFEIGDMYSAGENYRFGWCPETNARFDQMPFNASRVHSQAHGDVESGFSRNVSRNYIPKIRKSLSAFEPHCFGLGSHLDTSANEMETDGLMGEAIFAGKLMTRFSGIVFLDQVVEVRNFFYSGHVYDLGTDVGHYGVGGPSGNNIIVHNCIARAIFIDDWQALRDAGAQMETTW